ncbi:MAG: monovalent cation/H(+) antiporter subunit G [Lachnospiraceae bacterium]|nr:monovalent cation/H(+) antiporter subunit G [Lachnospiraceae bacterium]
MAVIEWLQFLVGAALLLLGLGIFTVEMIGVYRFQYVLNRMHAAAMGDTLGIGFCLVGLIVMNGANLTSLKLFLVVCFLWFSSPTSSHLIARLEVTTDPEPQKHYRKVPLDQLEAELKEKENHPDTTKTDSSITDTVVFSKETGMISRAGEKEDTAAECHKDLAKGRMTDTQGAEA